MGESMDKREYLFRARISDQVSRMLCASPVIKQMTPRQVATMHVFKHEVLTAFHRVYTEVPAKFADPLLDKFLKNLRAVLRDDQVPVEDDETP